MTGALQLRRLAGEGCDAAMRVPISGFFILLFLWAGAAEAASCKAGETVTLEGEIIIPPVFDAGE